MTHLTRFFYNIQEKVRTLTRLDLAVKLVWKSSRQWMIAGFALSVFQGALPLGLLYLIKKLVDLIAVGTPPSGDALAVFAQAMLLIGLAALVSLLDVLCQSLSSIVSKHQTELVTEHVTGMLHAKSIEVDLEFYDNPAYFDSLHKAQREAPSRPLSIVNGLLSLVRNSITLVALAGLFVMLDTLLALLLFITVIPGFLVRLYFSRQLYQQLEAQAERERKTSYLNWLLTGLSYAKEIRLFSIGPFLKNRYAALRTALREERLNLATKQAWADLAAQAPPLVAIFGTLAFITWRVVQGAATVGSLVMYYQAFQRAQNSLKTLLGSLASLYQDSLFISHFEDFLTLDPKIKEPKHPIAFPEPVKNGIAFDRVGFSYPGCDKPVFTDISFTIKPGEHVAIVGENGAGKTTLVKLLCRLHDPTSGKISVDGIDFKQLGLEKLRSEISALFQDYAKYQASVRENIWFGNIDLPDDTEAVTRAAKCSGADAVVQNLPQGYETLLGKMFHGGHELSIGQWQKIALARAFVRKSSLIILDEPASSLDVQSEYELFSHFHRIAEGKTAVIISHRLSTVKMVDRILVLNHGRLAEIGSHEELMKKNGIYARLFTMQAEKYH